MNRPKQKASLRGHNAAITCSISFEDFNSNTNILVTSDENGWISCWDILTKRPIAVWRAHSSTVLSLLQIEQNLLLTHGKDSSIRIWVLDNSKQLARSFPEDDAIDNGSHPWPEYIEIPVNTLNFCNVSYLHGLLLTPATQDSNNFDLYSIFPAKARDMPDFELRLSLKRLIANADPLKLHQKAVKDNNAANGIEFEIGEESAKRDGFGIMMNLLFVSPSLFYIGYESGHVLGFLFENQLSSIRVTEKDGGNSFDSSVINKDATVKLSFYSDFHCPHPITVLRHNEQLYVGSAGKKLTVHAISSITNQESLEAHNLKFAGVQDICVQGPLVVLAFWNGGVTGYKHNELDLKKLWSLQRDVPRLAVLETNNGQKDKKEQPDKTKAKTVYFISIKQQQGSSYRELIRYRKMQSSVLVVGYNDGIVIMYEV